MNFKSSFCAFKNLSLGLFVLAWAALPQISWAGAFGSIRPITSNSIYQCSTGSSWELIMGNGNMTSSSATFSMGCIDNDNTARWLITSTFLCQEGFCRSAPVRDYNGASYDANNGTYTRKLPTAVAGIDCKLEESRSSGYKSYKWVCQKLIPYKNITIKTVGNSKGEYYGTFINRYGKLPTIENPITANSARQAEILKGGKVCYGSVGFCK